MKFEVKHAFPIEVTFSDDTKRTFPGKQEIVNHLTSAVKSRENCIAYYEKELIKLKAELIPLQEDLALASAMTLPESE